MNEYFIAQHLITARVSDVDNIGLTYYTFTQLVGQQERFQTCRNSCNISESSFWCT